MHRRVTRLRRPVAAALVAACIAAGGAVAAAPASAAPETVTLRGSVVADAGGEALGTVRVGFWSVDGTVRAAGRTDAAGRFALSVPATARGVVYAGWRPDSQGVFHTTRGYFVRGVIGDDRPHGVPAVIAARAQADTAAHIADDGAVAFRLQRAGRIAGADGRLVGVVAGAAAVRRLDGSLLSATATDDAGAFLSRPLVPGTYRVTFRPAAPWREATSGDVVVRAGATTTVPTPELIRGATVAGRVTLAGAPVATNVTLLAGGRVVERTRSDDTGAYTFAGLASGAYVVVVGPNFLRDDDEADPVSLVEPARREIEIGADRADRTVDVAVRDAARVSGTAVGGRGRAVFVLAQTADGSTVTQATADRDGAYTMLGLQPGTPYRFVAVSEAKGVRRYDTLSVTPTAGDQTVAPLDASAKPALVITGDAQGVRTVLVRSRTDPALSVDVQHGRYRVAVVPGRYTLTTLATGRLPRNVAQRIERSRALDLARGARFGRVAVRLRSAAAVLPLTAAIARHGGAGVARRTYLHDDRLQSIGRLPVGGYAFVPGSIAPPVSDGPWWYRTPTQDFAVRAGGRTTVGPVTLTIAGG